MSENKFGKYILYAIGEIVLVVIGILIALQIDTWNENRKNTDVAHNYLNSLKEEFTYNREHLQKVMIRNTKDINYCLEIFKYTGPDQPKVSEHLFDSLLVNAIGYDIEVRPRSEILDEIISSGKLSLFNDQELRTSLSSWAGVLLRIRSQESELSKYRFQLLDLSAKTINMRDAAFEATGNQFKLSASKFPKQTLKLLQVQEFESIMAYYIGASQFQDQFYVDLDKKMEDILTHINKQLEK
jgi:hypothetical protein